jgi:hypothetical protein
MAEDELKLDDLPAPPADFNVESLPSPEPMAKVGPAGMPARGDMPDLGMSDEQKASFATGLGKGAFLPVEIVNKILPGERDPSLRHTLIARVEKLLGENLGDEKSKEYYRSLSEEDLKKKNLEQEEATRAKAPIAGAVGEFAGSLPATIAAGAGIGAAGRSVSGIAAAQKAAQAAGAIPLVSTGMKVAQAATNVAGAGALGEGLGIEKSNAPTLAERAQEAIPTAGLTAGIGAAAEVAPAILASKPVQQGLEKAGGVVKNLRDTFLRRSLGPTAADTGKLRNIQTQLGEQVFPAEGQNLVGPLTTKQGIAENLQAATREAGKDIEKVSGDISDAAAKMSNEIQSPMPLKAPGADVPLIEPSAASDVIKRVNPSGIASNAETLEEATSLVKPKSFSAEMTPEGGFNVKANVGTENVIPVERVVNPELEKNIVQKITSSSLPVQQQVQSLMNPEVLAKELEAELVPVLTKEGRGAELLPKVAEEINTIRSIEDPTLSGFFKNRMGLDDKIFKEQLPNAVGGRDDTPVSKALKLYRKLLDDKLMQRAKEVDRLAGTDSFKTLQDAKARYSVLKQASNVAQRSLNRQESVAAQSTPALIGGIAGKAGALALGSGANLPALAGAGLAYGTKALGNQFAANSLNLLQKALINTPKTFGKYAPMLQEANQRGASALAALNFALYNRDPNYRAIIDPLHKEGEDQMDQQ